MKRKKTRFSIEAAQYTNEREDWYKRECYNIIFDYKSDLIIENEGIYISDGAKRTFLAEPTGRDFWFQTWTALKNYYNIEKIYHKS